MVFKVLLETKNHQGGISMKQELMNKLIELLEHEYRVYENILRMSKDKTNIIVEGKVKELENVVKLEQALVLQISRIDKQREEVVEQLSKEVNLKDNNLNISEIIQYGDREQKQQLEEYRGKMGKLIAELAHTNQINSKLIENSLEYIDFSLNLMANADVTSNNYGNKGSSTERSRKNLFDIKL